MHFNRIWDGSERVWRHLKFCKNRAHNALPKSLKEQFSDRFDFADLGHPTWGDVNLSVGGTQVEDRNDFPFVQDPTQADPAEDELNNPELALNAGVRWSVGNFTFNTSHQYLGKQALPGVEIGDALGFETAFTDEIWIHDASVRWEASDDYTVTFGVQNLLNEHPYVGSVVTPVSSVARYFFLPFATRY